MRRAFVLLGLVALAAGCGGSSGSSPSTSSLPAVQERMSVVVYVVRDGKLAAERREVPRTQAAARAAITSLLPDATIDRLEIADGTAQVTLTPEPDTLEQAQVVYTLTEFPSVKRVAIGGRTLTRTDLDSFAPPILVVEPQPGDTIGSPVRVHGSADAYEATFVVDVVDATGKVVTEQTVMATSGSGERGDFDVTIPFSGAKPGDGKIVAFEYSAENGQRIHIVEVPVVIS